MKCIACTIAEIECTCEILQKWERHKLLSSAAEELGSLRRHHHLASIKEHAYHSHQLCGPTHPDAMQDNQISSGRRHIRAFGTCLANHQTKMLLQSYQHNIQKAETIKAKPNHNA